jgi:hypothetical protein
MQYISEKSHKVISNDKIYIGMKKNVTNKAYFTK